MSSMSTSTKNFSRVAMGAPRSPSVAPTIAFSRVNASCSRGGSVFSAALTFKRRLMNKLRVKTRGCGLLLLPISARTFRKGSSWLSRHDSGGNSPRRPPTVLAFRAMVMGRRKCQNIEVILQNLEVTQERLLFGVS